MSIRPRGPLTGWTPKPGREAAMLADLRAVIAEHDAAGTLPRPGRGLFYDLRPAGRGHGLLYVKAADCREGVHFDYATRGRQQVRRFREHVVTAEHVQELLALARRAEVIAEADIADGKAPDPLRPWSYDDADQIAADVLDTLARAVLTRQAGQPVFVETWCESDNLAPSLFVEADPLGVPVYPSGGFGGNKGKRAAGMRAARRTVPTLALHVGDLDQRGRDLFTAAAEDAAAWCGHTLRRSRFPAGRAVTERDRDGQPVRVRQDRDGVPWLTVVRLALTPTMAARLDLLDANGKAEAEGIPPLTLRRLLRVAVLLATDHETRQGVLDSEADARRDAVRQVLDRLDTDDDDTDDDTEPEADH